MKYKINTYVAVLLITIAGAGAAMLIVKTTSSLETPRVVSPSTRSAAGYAHLQQEILSQ